LQTKGFLIFGRRKRDRFGFRSNEMALEYCFGIIAFIFLAIGLVAVYLGETEESFYSDKNRTGVISDVCSGVATVWFFIPFLTSVSNWVFAFMVLVAIVFYYFTARFYRKSSWV